MKKAVIVMAAVALLATSCGNETSGAYTGAQFGSIIGSVVGDLVGGWRGRDIGTLAGMAGGAAVGAVVGKNNERKAEQRYEDYRRQRQARKNNDGVYAPDNRTDSRFDNDNRLDNDGVYDPNGRGDDRITIDGLQGPVGRASAPAYLPQSDSIVIRRVSFADKDRNDILVREEKARVVMEIENTSWRTLYDIRPQVTEVTGNRHIEVSQNVVVESLAPKQAIRYTAMVMTDKKLKEGEAVFRVAVKHGNREVVSQTRELRVKTAKR